MTPSPTSSGRARNEAMLRTLTTLSPEDRYALVHGSDLAREEVLNRLEPSVREPLEQLLETARQIGETLGADHAAKICEAYRLNHQPPSRPNACASTP